MQRIKTGHEGLRKLKLTATAKSFPSQSSDDGDRFYQVDEFAEELTVYEPGFDANQKGKGIVHNARSGIDFVSTQIPELLF